ncbi:Zinc finger CCCH domain-containing protein 14 [Zootermopsis nevadensis]|uniref:Zinc finger CCCH domain-containing protein 14 n=1 Tax=Zootermopsis nevadensis TaxID=136037 RepID=A0A067RD70_ZOONE|nr:Zinc finger CCCH domain-containing protein 14 [Zootermopsis nevadensis]
MDGIGAEVSQKIRSAIKAKLMELGVYVDEELPDYIMVMVANKRSREQMDDDLQLFLGSNTEEFTGWLHQVLQKLQEVTVASLERKRKSSTGENEGENFKKDKRRKSSEKKKGRRSGEQTRGKDAKDDSENVNQHSGKHKELEEVTKNHLSLDQNVSSNQVNVEKGNEYISKCQSRTDEEQNDKSSSHSHALGTTKLSETPACSDSVSSNDSGKLHRDGVNLKSIGMSQIAPDSQNRSDEIYLGKSVCRKISLAGKTIASSKIICSAMEESSNVAERSVLNPIKKGTSSGSELDIAELVILRSAEEKTLADAKASATASRTKIVLMQSDDDDDEDFINIKADAEAEELLDAELPKEPCHSGMNSMKIVTAALSKGIDDTKTAFTADKQSESGVRGLQLSDRLGAKVTSGSVLRKVTALSHESNSSLLRITDRLGDKVIPLVTDIKKAGSLVSDGVPGHREERRCNIVPASNRSSISEQRNISVAHVAPSAVSRMSRLMNINTETEQLGPRTLRRPLEEEQSGDKDQGSRKRPLLSRVVAMSRRAADKEEEYDPTNPAVGSVASVVRVKPRPKVPASLQANKNLILKAMAEAQKSVASAPKRVEPDERPGGLFTRKFRDCKGGDKIAITLPNRRMQPHEDAPVTGKPSGVERIVIPVKLEASRSISSVNLQQKIVIQVSSDKPTAPEIVPPPPPDTVDSKTEEVVEGGNLISDYEEESAKLIEVAPSTESEETGEVQRLAESWPKDLDFPETSSVRLPEASRAESPQFVVTLDGLDPSIFRLHSQKKERSSSVVMNSPNVDSESSATEYEEKEVHRSRGIQTEKEREKRVSSPILFEKSGSPDATVADVLKQKVKDRCKYWPACRSGDRCDYVHPTVPCKSFPSCKFGDKCLYIHPNCKFDASCTRRDCPFTHASPRNMCATSSGKVLSMKSD